MAPCQYVSESSVKPLQVQQLAVRSVHGHLLTPRPLLGPLLHVLDGLNLLLITLGVFPLHLFDDPLFVVDLALLKLLIFHNLRRRTRRGRAPSPPPRSSPGSCSTPSCNCPAATTRPGRLPRTPQFC